MLFPLHGFQRSTAAALCDITTEVLRTLNATESAMTELAPSNPNDRPQLAGTDVKKADDAYRELEENVRSQILLIFNTYKSWYNLSINWRE